MNETILLWWRGRSRREQWLLGVMTVLLALVLAWLLVVRPLGDALSDARKRHGEAVVALGEARTMAARIRAAQRQTGAAPTAPVDLLVSQSASEAGFTVARLDRQSSRQATIVIEAVRPQAFFAWVAQLENERNLIVERLSATTNSDQTLAVQVGVRAKGE